MQLTIGIVEDEPLYLDQLMAHINHWQEETRCQTEIFSFSDCQSLLSSPVSSLDIIFLDIQLPDGTGVFLARELRRAGYGGALVFLTAFKEYVFEGYQVHALNYLLKPVSYEAVADCLSTVSATQTEGTYICHFRDTLVKIPYHRILSFHSARHHVEIATTTGEHYLQYDTLNHILQQLPSQFRQCHRTIVVNMQQVQQICGKTLSLSDHSSLPVSTSYLEKIRSAFLENI